MRRALIDWTSGTGLHSAPAECAVPSSAGACLARKSRKFPWRNHSKQCTKVILFGARVVNPSRRLRTVAAEPLHRRGRAGLAGPHRGVQSAGVGNSGCSSRPVWRICSWPKLAMTGSLSWSQVDGSWCGYGPAGTSRGHCSAVLLDPLGGPPAHTTRSDSPCAASNGRKGK